MSDEVQTPVLILHGKHFTTWAIVLYCLIFIMIRGNQLSILPKSKKIQVQFIR